MKTSLIVLALTISLMPLNFTAAGAAPVFNNTPAQITTVPDILHLIQRKSRQQRVSDCIGRALVDRDDVYEACDAGLPNKNGSRQPCYDIGDMQYRNDVAACRRMQ